MLISDCYDQTNGGTTGMATQGGADCMSGKAGPFTTTGADGTNMWWNNRGIVHDRNTQNVASEQHIILIVTSIPFVKMAPTIVVFDVFCI